VDVEDLFTDLPALATARLRLRRLTEDDAEGLFAIFANDEVTRYYAWDTFTDVAQAQELATHVVELYTRGQALRWGLLPVGGTRIVGTCGYTRWSREDRFAVLGFDLARPYWGRGLASEAAAAVIGFGFGRMGLHRVEATVMAGNAASAQLLTRAGFRLEGRLAERAWHRGAYHDVEQYGLLEPWWTNGSCRVGVTAIPDPTRS
jgi:ribosomal-protein-alanine N-acetyltransferase